MESLRTGKRVELLSATAQADGRTVLIGRAWPLIAASADFPAPPPSAQLRGIDAERTTSDAALPDGAVMTPWQRVLTVADSGSGISVCVPPAEYPAIN